MLIVGSYVASSIIERTCSDIDIICTWDDFRMLQKELSPYGYKSIVISKNKWVLLKNHNCVIFECEIAWEGSTAQELLTYADAWCEHSGHLLDNVLPGPVSVEWVKADIDILYTLKMSHRYLKNSPHFAKTMKDIKAFRAIGAKVFDAEWLKRREAETYDYGLPNLNRSKDEFFTDDVTYIYDHDSVHEVVAVDPGVPAYTKYMTDGAQVLWSKDKFFSLPKEVRIAGVYEEAAVLALERAIVYSGAPEREAFPFALEKVCTSITSGAFREYAWEHYDDAIIMWKKQFELRGPLIDLVTAKLQPILTAEEIETIIRP